MDTLKQLIWDKEGIDPYQQRLIWDGEVLENRWSLCDYGVENQDTVHLVLRLTGGGGPRFADVSNAGGLSSAQQQPCSPAWPRKHCPVNAHMQDVPLEDCAPVRCVRAGACSSNADARCRMLPT